MNRPLLSQSILAAAIAVLLSACGGGSGASGASPALLGSSTISGTVTGFGSVIVDGVRVDDRKVAAGIEQDDGSVVLAELKLGQHVELAHDASLVATQVRITSEVKGPVGAIDLVAGTLTILGQTVTINTVADKGPVTVFDAPFTSLADIKGGDTVEVHGLIVTDAAGKTTVQATRIEQKPAGPFNHVKGNVTELSTAASTFKVGALLVSFANATVKPSAAALANGVQVRVEIPAGAGTTAGAVNASVVKVKNHRDESGDKDVRLGGPIGKIDAAAKTFFLDGVKVDASGAVFEQANAGFGNLTEGTYVRAKGTFLADGSLKAASIVLRKAEQGSGHETELHGSILDFVSNAHFTVRGQLVDATSASISCPGSALANNVQVEVGGRLTATGTIVASEVKCEKAQDGESIVERRGAVATLDVAAKTLTIAALSDVTTVVWSGTTVFVGVDAATLSGKTIEIEGTLAGGVFTATKIKLED